MSDDMPAIPIIDDNRRPPKVSRRGLNVAGGRIANARKTPPRDARGVAGPMDITHSFDPRKVCMVH